MSTASVMALLQAALLLLSLAQNNSSLPQSLRDSAIQTAQHAISVATVVIANNGNSTLQTYTPPSSQPSASIDQNSLYYTTDKDAGFVTVTGSASNLSAVTVALKGYNGGSAAVVNGRWSVVLQSALPAGSYLLQVTNNDTGSVLANGTLTVVANGRTTSTLVPSPVINAFYSSVNNIPAGSASTLSWRASNTGACGISVVSGGSSGIDLSKSTSDNSGVTSVTTGPLQQTTTYELRCAPLTGASSGYAIQDVTVFVTPPGNVTFTPGSHSMFMLVPGQTATDGPAGVRITLQSVSKDGLGNSMANVYVTSYGAMPGYYSARAGMPLLFNGSFTDTLSQTGGLIIDVTSFNADGSVIFTVDPGIGKG